jgi:photosystem II stability/assembly factor-like uncharacterized protein
MQDATTGWGLESAGHIVRTTDGGSTWRDVTPPHGRYDETDFFALDASHAWAVDGVQASCGPAGNSFCLEAVIWRTSEGGGIWHYTLPRVTDGAEFIPLAMQFANETTGWLI